MSIQITFTSCIKLEINNHNIFFNKYIVILDDSQENTQTKEGGGGGTSLPCGLRFSEAGILHFAPLEGEIS